jgi:hypothetical protein
MRKAKRLKNKQFRKSEINLFCQNAQDVLTKIHERCEQKKLKKQQRKSYNLLSLIFLFISFTGNL